jgi:acetyl esterase/lipase
MGLRRDQAYGSDSLQRVDVYTRGRFVGEPKWFVADTAAHPTFVWIHGGGFVAGDKADELPYFAAFLQRGWVVVSVNYRQGAGVGADTMKDVVCAMRWLRTNAARYGIDTARVVVGGGSAGGALALVAGTATPRDPSSCDGPAPLSAKAIVNQFGVADLLAEDVHLQSTIPGQNFGRLWAGGFDGVKRLDAQWSPVRRVSKQTPPVYTLHGERDAVVPVTQSDSLNAALARAGVKHVYQREPNANHGGFSESQFARYEQQLFAFLRSLGF